MGTHCPSGKINDLHMILRDGHAFHQLLLDVVLGDHEVVIGSHPEFERPQGSTSGPRAWAHILHS